MDDLKQFFSAYFHEDWQCDDPTPDQVIARYIRDHQGDSNHVAMLGTAVIRLSNDACSDSALKGKLLQLGCYYSPNDVRSWLRHVGQVLQTTG